MTQPTCETCRFFSQSELLCRRNPPQAATPSIYIQYKWPLVAKADWCGEHQPSRPRMGSRTCIEMSRKYAADSEARWRMFEKRRKAREAASKEKVCDHD